MTRGNIRTSVVTAKVELIRRMLRQIAELPLSSPSEFVEDSILVGAGESFLRRALEALLDLGRHILAKGFGIATSEYKEIPIRLEEVGVLPAEQLQVAKDMAGYRNRLVHFYEDVTPEELYGILTEHAADIEGLLDSIRRWVTENPEWLDSKL